MQEVATVAALQHFIASHHAGLLDFPPEILLHILSYLDLPELSELARICPALDLLTSDPILHFQRLWIVSPSRVSHQLFGRSPEGHSLRPTVGDLVQRGVMKGFGIDRRWRRGLYLYSLDSILQYQNGLALSKRHAQHILSDQLRRRIKHDVVKSKGVVGAIFSAQSLAPPIALGSDQASRLSHASLSFANSFSTKTGTISGIIGSNKSAKVALCSNPFKAYLLTLHSTRILPDIESSSPFIARSLLPTMRKLKWCLQRDNLAREFKNSGRAVGGFGFWLDGQAAKGKENIDPVHGGLCQEETKRTRTRVFVDSERLRLAVCPDMKQRVGFYEKLGQEA